MNIGSVIRERPLRCVSDQLVCGVGRPSKTAASVWANCEAQRRRPLGSLQKFVLRHVITLESGMSLPGFVVIFLDQSSFFLIDLSGFAPLSISSRAFWNSPRSFGFLRLTGGPAIFRIIKVTVVYIERSGATTLP
jgi:hypothetical protein